MPKNKGGLLDPPVKKDTKVDKTKKRGRKAPPETGATARVSHIAHDTLSFLHCKKNSAIFDVRPVNMRGFVRSDDACRTRSGSAESRMLQKA